MKKYVKPVLYYENYVLSNQIASCEYDPINLEDEKTCAFEADFDPSLTIFSDAIEGCKFTDINMVCYHGSSGGLSLFNS